MKKFIGFALIIVMLSSMSNLVYASTNVTLSDKQKAATIKSEIQKDVNIQKYLREKGKHKVPTIEEIKKVLNDFFKKHPKGNEQNIKNIDAIAKECVQFVQNLENYDVGIQDWRWYVHMHQWVSGPTITSTGYYSVDGEKHEIDNRRSSLPYTETFSSSISATGSVGFSGSAEIKDAISGSISASTSYTYTETVSATITVSPYLYWSRQAYALMKTEYYTGTQAIYKFEYVYIPLTTVGTWTFVYDHNENVSGSNTNGYGGGVRLTSYK